MSDDDESLFVTGNILFEKDAKSFSNATVYVKLLDIGKQDTESKTITSQIIENVSFDQDKKQPVSFSLKGHFTKSQFTTFAVSVLVDLDGDAEISLGDFITMTNYEVLAKNCPEDVTVTVHRVT